MGSVIMDTSQELDIEIQKAAEEVKDAPTFVNLMTLIEIKIRSVSKRDDLTSFSSLIKELNLGKGVGDLLIKVRNRVVHTSEKEIDFEKEIEPLMPFLISQIIPAVISYKSSKRIPIVGTKLEVEVMKKVKALGFETVINQSEMESLLKSRINSDLLKPLRPDLLVKIKDKIIVFEVKRTLRHPIDSKYIGLQQLEKFLLGTNLKYGVLVISGSEVEYHKSKESNILVLGYDADFNNFTKWVKKI